MSSGKKNRSRRPQAGIALLIAIFILMLISVIAIALIVSSGTESALAGNYRSSTGVYYAALAGLEEARGRLLGADPNALQTTDPGFIPVPPIPMAVGAPVYLINPDLAAGEVVAPWDPSSTYPDTEFVSEFGVSPPNPSPSALSVWNRAPLNGLPIPGPLFKWVRINAVSEASLKVDTGSGGSPATGPLYYDGTRFNNSPSSGSQVLELTAFGALPNGSRKVLQYLIARSSYPGFPGGMNFQAGLTIAGSATYHPPNLNANFFVSGVNPPPSCPSGAPVHSIGVFNNSDASAIPSSIPAIMRPLYKGVVSPAPDVANVSGLFPAILQTPSQLDKLAQAVAQSADVVLNPPPSTFPWTAHGSDMPLPLPTPQTIVVNGNLDLTSWHNTGYGLLLVTGNLIYDPDVTWNGIILVIGQGTVTGDNAGSGVINGAMFVARTRDISGNLLPDPGLGPASVLFDDDMQGLGIQYNSCLVQNVQSSSKFSYKILSFHEITQ
jgi:hypothetical protein